jgi:hypothetical protein
VWLTDAPLPFVPSPKVQAYVMDPPHGELADALKLTAVPTQPGFGLPVTELSVTVLAFTVCVVERLAVSDPDVTVQDTVLEPDAANV